MRPRCDISVLVDVVHQLPGVFAAGVRPSVLIHLPIASALLNYLQTQRQEKRRAGGEVRVGLGVDRRGELTLELKRIISYLCSRQQRDCGVSFSFDRFPAWGLISATSTQASRGVVQKRNKHARHPQSRPGYITVPEMTQVVVRCEQVLARIQAESLAEGRKASISMRRDYVRHFVPSSPSASPRARSASPG